LRMVPSVLSSTLTFLNGKIIESIRLSLKNHWGIVNARVKIYPGTREYASGGLSDRPRSAGSSRERMPARCSSQTVFN
jgi:hypothetical protein